MGTPCWPTVNRQPVVDSHTHSLSFPENNYLVEILLAQQNRLPLVFGSQADWQLDFHAVLFWWSDAFDLCSNSHSAGCLPPQRHPNSFICKSRWGDKLCPIMMEIISGVVLAAVFFPSSSFLSLAVNNDLLLWTVSCSPLEDHERSKCWLIWCFNDGKLSFLQETGVL